MSHMAGKRRGTAIALVLASAMLGTLIAVMEGREAWSLLKHAQWNLLPAALLFTAISYFCLSAGYAAMNRIFGIDLPSVDLLEVGFVSFALNNLISVSGLAGYSLRLILLRRRGLEGGDVLGASLVHSYFNHIVMMSMLPAGLIYVLVNHPLGREQTLRMAMATAVALLVLVATTLLLLWARLRRVIARAIAALGRRVLGRDFGPFLQHLDETLGRGIAAARAHPMALGLPLLFVLLDWAASVLVLAVCFEALGDRPHLGVLLTGFAIGVTVGFLSMLPGGMGAQEGSMTGIYVLLGVQLEQAVLAAVLFRVVYYIVPFVASLVLYSRLLRARPEPGAVSG